MTRLLIPILGGAAVSVLIFWQFFFKGLMPFPGNYMLAWYEPWKTNYTRGETITIPHKAVADDTFRHIYPFKVLGTQLLKEHKFPLWNPFNGAGNPLFATYQWSLLNPVNFLFFFLDPRLAWSFSVVIQEFLLFFFSYIYFRKIKISTSGSIFSSLVFSLSGFVIARLIFNNIVYPLTMLPAVLYLIEDYAINPNGAKKFLLPFAIFFLFVSGHPHISVYVLIFTAIYLLFRVRNFLPLIFLFFLGLGLSAIQLFPTFELLKNSNMNQGSSAFIFERFLLPVSHLISIAIPNYFGNQSTYNYWGAADYIETVAALGIIPLFFAYFCLIEKSNFQKWHKVFFGISALVPVLLTLDWILPKIFYSLPIPIISTSPPSRIFVITSFALAAMSGYGFDSWLSYKKSLGAIIKKSSPFIILACSIVIGTIIFERLNVDCNNLQIPDCRHIASRNTLFEAGFFALFLTLFFLGIQRKDKRIFAYLIIGIILFLGTYNSNKFLPFSQKETIFPIHPLLTQLKTLDARVFGFGKANIKTDFSVYYQYFDPNIYEPLYNRRYGELVSFANTGEINSPLGRSNVEIVSDLEIDPAKDKLRKRLLNLLGVSYFVYSKDEKEISNALWQDNDWLIEKNLEALSRVYTVNNFEIIKDNDEILKRLFDTNFDIEKSVILENYPSFVPEKSDLIAKISGAEYGENKVKVKLSSPQGSILVLSDSFFPGWKAYLDNKQTEILRANYSFRAVAVPRGDHTIVFSYEPLSFSLGIVFSIFSLFLFSGYYLLYRRRN